MRNSHIRRRENDHIRRRESDHITRRESDHIRRQETVLLDSEKEGERTGILEGEKRPY